MERDKCLYYKEGVKYYTTKFYRIKLDIYPKEEVLLTYSSFDINDNPIMLPLVRLKPNGSLIIYPRYAWDGASGPTWDSKSSMIGSLVHDVLYQLIRLGLIDESYKPYADKILHDCCVEDGMFAWRADYWRWAVLEFGNGACKPSSEPKELVAP